MRQTADREMAVAAVQQHVAARLARPLKLDESKISLAHRSMVSFGLNSMIGGMHLDVKCQGPIRITGPSQKK